MKLLGGEKMKNDNIDEFLVEIREKTLKDLMKKLRLHQKCALIRPTGFGKTCMLTNLIKSYKKVLYLYPAEVIKNTVVYRYYQDADNVAFDEETRETLMALGEIENVTLMTYAKLNRLKKGDLEVLGYDLIVADECHRLGGHKTMSAMGFLLSENPNAHFVGATATPNRSDGLDVVNIFFNDVTVFPYTLHDAFMNGVLKIPNYCYCPTDHKTNLKEEALMVGEDINDLKVREVLKKQLVEISNLYGMENIIKTNCNEYLEDTNYMKFIVFFSCIEQMLDKAKDVTRWYKKAFPDHHIRQLFISSENLETKKNVDELETLLYTDKTIDLVFCIEMLNMGYHVNDISGVVMYRGTKSDIIYVQQLGRALSSGASTPCLVFDIVDNLHRKAVFELQKEPLEICPDGPLGYKTIWKVVENKENGKKEVVNEEDGRKGPFIIGDDNKVLNTKGNPTRLWIENDGYLWAPIKQTKDNRWINSVDKILAEDLHMSSTMASYREIIAKAVAEPMSQRVKEAWEAHFRRWCEVNNLPYPISDEDLKKLFLTSKEEFTNTYRNIILKKGWDYPMGDVKKLKKLGKDGSEMIPLEMFAKWKNVSIKAITDLLVS